MSNSDDSVKSLSAGFTLLEVLVSLAIIAIVFVSVLRLQGQTISMNESTRFYAVAPFLAQQKMAEVTADPSSFSGSQSGDFGEDAPGYVWKAGVDDFPITGPDGGTIELSLAVVTVTQEGSGLKLIIKEYLSEARKDITE
ncbi:MAG: prepilin-type N-terminal cleavage/methylation domain-containing protein [Deltaproteobacteria bacterium]|nr:prepilin-type N-terminal cleavage/methylation domain-containing protein [Deltaproteobacteria bacterium]